MTSKKAKLLIAGAWILSFVICFPPLVGWKDNDNKTENAMDQIDFNETTHGMYVISAFAKTEYYQCFFTSMSYTYSHFFKPNSKLSKFQSTQNSIINQVTNMDV